MGGFPNHLIENNQSSVTFLSGLAVRLATSSTVELKLTISYTFPQRCQLIVKWLEQNVCVSCDRPMTCPSERIDKHQSYFLAQPTAEHKGYSLLFLLNHD